MPRRRETNPELIKLRKIEKRLGELNYTPQSAKTLASFLEGLSRDEPGIRECRLQAFRDLSHPRFGVFKK